MTGCMNPDQRRRIETEGEYFAEWFSIHPPFPPHSFYSSRQQRTTWTKEPGVRDLHARFRQDEACATEDRGA